MSDFSKRLKELRKSKGLTTTDLGEILGTANSTISRYENNKRTPDSEFLIKSSQYFNVSTDYLLGLTNIKQNNDDDVIIKIKLAKDKMKEKEKEKLEKILEVVFDDYF